MRIFTFSNSDANSHSRMLRPGDRVDVTVSFTTREGQLVNRILLECIEFFAIESKVVGSEDDKNFLRDRNVSLLLTPEQVGVIQVAQSRGQLGFALRNPNDDEVNFPNGINVEAYGELRRSTGIPQELTVTDASLLAKLQGTWDVELDAADIQFPGTRAEVTIEGNLLKLWEIVPPQPGLTTETLRTEAGAMLLTLGAVGPPQLIDLVIGPNDGDKRRETQGIIEITGDTVKLCYDPQHTKGEIQRPVAFAIGKHAELLVFKRRVETAQATELEGDWHLFAYFDHEGKPQETLPSNRSFRGDQSSFFRPGYRHDCRIKVDPIKKTLWSYSKEEDGSFGQDYYELKGHQLILRNKPGDVGHQVFERGLVRIPSVVPPATEEQKLLWRSAIVEIVTYGDSHVNNGGENVVGRGVVVSPGGLILTHLVGRWDPPLKDRKVIAKFDDGSQIPLTVVEEGDGLIAFQPEKPINANHYFKVSQTVVQPHDEVRIWGPDHSQAGNQSLAPYADSVTVLDRKYPALGIVVWQLRFSHHAVLGTPILDAEGDLLGITITGTRDLLLAVPVAQLKALFQKSLGQLTPMPSDTPPAAPMISPQSPAVPVPVAPQSEGP